MQEGEEPTDTKPTVIAMVATGYPYAQHTAFQICKSSDIQCLALTWHAITIRSKPHHCKVLSLRCAKTVINKIKPSGNRPRDRHTSASPVPHATLVTLEAVLVIRLHAHSCN